MAHLATDRAIVLLPENHEYREFGVPIDKSDRLLLVAGQDTGICVQNAALPFDYSGELVSVDCPF